jgi:hypothetical protein
MIGQHPNPACGYHVCETARDLSPNRLPTMTLVGRTTSSLMQCVTARGMGSDLNADRTSDPTPNNSSDRPSARRGGDASEENSQYSGQEDAIERSGSADGRDRSAKAIYLVKVEQISAYKRP